MRIAIIRYGICRESKIVGKFLRENLYNPLLNSKHQINCFYFYRYVDNLEDSRSDRENKNFRSKPYKIYEGEKIKEYKLEKNLKKINFNKIFKNDIYEDNFRSFRNLINQCRILRFASKEIDIFNYDYLIICRDDVIVSFKEQINNIFKKTSSDYITSIYNWHGGIFERFFICKPKIFNKLIYKDKIIFNKFKKSKFKLDSNRYCGEKLSHKIIKETNAKILALPIHTYRIRVGPTIHPEKHKIRYHDLNELVRILIVLIRQNFDSWK